MKANSQRKEKLEYFRKFLAVLTVSLIFIKSIFKIFFDYRIFPLNITKS
jgi:hypothetical protein